MRITKRVREEAAHFCALMASSNNELMHTIINGTADPAIDFSEASGNECHKHGGPADLARAAYWAVATPDSCDREAWAEAEAMIRTGWSCG